jgi:hypothetical protein
MPQQAPGYFGYYGYPAYTPNYSQPSQTTPVQPAQPKAVPQPQQANNDAELMKLLASLSQQQQQTRPAKSRHGEDDGHGHGKTDLESNKVTKAAKHLAIAGGMFLFGMLLNSPLMPSRNPHAFKLISPDWKDWGKIIAGIATVSQFNKAFELKPSPFVSAAESVAVINALSVGFTKGSALQMLFLAPIVGTVVQTASYLNEKVAEPLKEKFGIPTLVTKLAISAGTIVLGLRAYPLILKAVAKSGLIGKEAQRQAVNNVGKLTITAEGVICSRGCCNFILCLSEIGEMVSAYFNKGKKPSQSERSSY